MVKVAHFSSRCPPSQVGSQLQTRYVGSAAISCWILLDHSRSSHLFQVRCAGAWSVGTLCWIWRRWTWWTSKPKGSKGHKEPMLLGSPGQVHDLWGGEVEALNSFRESEDVGHFWRQTSNIKGTSKSEQRWTDLGQNAGSCPWHSNLAPLG